MSMVHLIVPELLLPKEMASEALSGVSAPALQKLIGRGNREMFEHMSLEKLLCLCFDLSSPDSVPIAPISAEFDGLAAGCWMRADPVHLNLQGNRLVLTAVQIRSDEAEQVCRSLNVHYGGQGIEFFAPDPQRWYVRLQAAPRIHTVPPSQVIGDDIRGALPAGEEAVYWHKLFNEIQMLLFGHPVNELRIARGELPVNSVWFWGGGCHADVSPKHTYDVVTSSDVLAEMLSVVGGVSFLKWQRRWKEGPREERQLLVWTGMRLAMEQGDLPAWRENLRDFESEYARPIVEALRGGTISRLILDVLAGKRMMRITTGRADLRAFWRGRKSLAEFSFV
jgi:hypothetical protein